jgi:hypothetical protein
MVRDGENGILGLQNTPIRNEAAAFHMRPWKGCHRGTFCEKTLTGELEDLERDEKEYEGDCRCSLSLY